jgi:hypothetical protein
MQQQSRRHVRQAAMRRKRLRPVEMQEVNLTANYLGAPI